MNHKELVRVLQSRLGANVASEDEGCGWASVCVLLRFRPGADGAKVLEILYMKRAPNVRDPYAFVLAFIQ
jgi:hypothetical protein